MSQSVIDGCGDTVLLRINDSMVRCGRLVLSYLNVVVEVAAAIDRFNERGGHAVGPNGQLDFHFLFEARETRQRRGAENCPNAMKRKQITSDLG